MKKGNEMEIPFDFAEMKEDELENRDKMHIYESIVNLDYSLFSSSSE